jgi:hypothetical protein
VEGEERQGRKPKEARGQKSGRERARRKKTTETQSPSTRRRSSLGVTTQRHTEKTLILGKDKSKEKDEPPLLSLPNSSQGGGYGVVGNGVVHCVSSIDHCSLGSSRTSSAPSSKMRRGNFMLFLFWPLFFPQLKSSLRVTLSFLCVLCVESFSVFSPSPSYRPSTSRCLRKRTPLTHSNIQTSTHLSGFQIYRYHSCQIRRA